MTWIAFSKTNAKKVCIIQEYYLQSSCRVELISHREWTQTDACYDKNEHQYGKDRFPHQAHILYKKWSTSQQANSRNEIETKKEQQLKNRRKTYRCAPEYKALQESRKKK